MATLGPLSLIQNQTPADAIPVNQNFQDIQQHVNTELINRDGSIPMTAPLILSDGNPAISSAEAAAGIPVGLMMDWPAATAPAGGDWVLCNGQVLTTADYPVLQALITDTYDEPGDSFGGTQFRVPNLNGRSSVGPGGDLGGALAGTGGRSDVAAPAHTHTLGSHTHTLAHTHTANHDHTGSGSSGNESNHSHGASHTHSFLENNAAGGHTHTSGAPGGTSFVWRPSGTVGFSVSAGSTHWFQDGGDILTTGTSGSHVHSLIIREADVQTTGGTSHSHTVSVSVNSRSVTTAGQNNSTTSGPTGGSGSTGDAGPNDNYHPVLVLNKIMKAR